MTDDEHDLDDLDDVDLPPELLEADGRPVFLLTEDGVSSGVLSVSPRLLRPRDDRAERDE